LLYYLLSKLRQQQNNLYLNATDQAIVSNNTFKSSILSISGNDLTDPAPDQITTKTKVLYNEFVPYSGEIHCKAIAAALTDKAHIEGNVFENPIGYVIVNTNATGMICVNNKYIRSYDSAAGNNFWYSTSITETNVTRGMKPNIIHDYINTKTWYVWNNGNAEEAFKLKLTGTDLTLINGGNSTKYLSEDGNYTTLQ